jgi:hypothetical protein
MSMRPAVAPTPIPAAAPEVRRELGKLVGWAALLVGSGLEEEVVLGLLLLVVVLVVLSVEIVAPALISARIGAEAGVNSGRSLSCQAT